MRHSELSSWSLNSSNEYFGSLRDFFFALSSSFIGASTFELIVGLVKRHRKENAIAWNFSWSVFPSKSLATLGSIAFRTTARLERYRKRRTLDHKYLRREKTLQPSCLKWKFSTNHNVRSGVGLLFLWQNLSHALRSFKYQPIRMRPFR